MWLKAQATRDEAQARDTRFITISEAATKDAKNLRAMASDLSKALKEGE